MANEINNENFSNLDIFRAIYTFNSKNEKLSTGQEAASLAARVMKVVMVIPVLAQIVAPIVLYSVISRSQEQSKKTIIACLSRIALSFFATPLLLAIDLAGTAVKSCLDEMAKRKEKQKLMQEVRNHPVEI